MAGTIKSSGYKVLIVDDEIHIADGIAQSIPWQELQVSSVNCAYSYDEAMELLDVEAVDIVLTDVQMPGKSGLELIRALHDKQQSTAYVVISGHSDFEYMREAIKYNVIDYILKPAPDREIIAAVKKCIDFLEKTWSENMSRLALEKSYFKSLPILRDELFKRIIHGNREKQSTLAQLLERYEIALCLQEQVRFWLVYVHQLSPGDEYLSGAIMNVTEELVSLGGLKSWACELEKNMIAILSQSSDDTALIGRIALSIQHNILLYLKCDVSVVVSTSAIFPDDCAMIYQSVREIFRRRLSDTSIIYIDTKHHTEGASSENPLFSDPQVSALLDAGDYLGAERCVEEIFAWYMTANKTGWYEAYCAIFHMVTSFLSKKGKKLQEIIPSSIFDLVSDNISNRTLAELSKAFCDIIRIIGDIEKSHESAPGMYYVERAKRYVLENDIASITVQLLAEALYIHPVYLSRLFKEETGMLLSDYLSAERLKIAEKLLRETSLTVGKISQQIGYANTPYFIKLFKKKYGKTPADYRLQF